MFSSLYLSFFVGVVTSLALLFVLIALGTKLKIIPQKSFRRKESDFTPLLGGVAIYLGALAGNFFYNNQILWMILLTGLPLIVIGILDDIFEINARTKLVGQILSTLAWIGLMSPSQMLFTQLGLPPVLGAVITFVFMAALQNSFNFMDGIDGQVSGMAIINFLFLGLAFAHLEAPAFLLLGATSSFLFLNFAPARIYLGESGSSFLGFALGALSTIIAPSQHQPQFGHLLGVIFLFSLPFCDLLTAIIRRASKGLPPWAPDRDHFHHKLIKYGLSVRQVTLITYMMVACASLTGYALLTSNSTHSLIAPFVTAVLLTFIYAAIMLLNRSVARKVSYFGRTLIEQHFPCSPKQANLLETQQCILFDLLPYYEEIQSKGISVVESFVFEIAHWGLSKVPYAEFRLIGSYSVLIVLDKKIELNKTLEKQISTSLYEVLLKQGVLRNIRLPPEGLSFFHDLKNAEARKLLSEHIASVRPIKVVS